MHETMAYFAFYKQQSTLLEFKRCYNFTLMILMASSCSDPFPSPRCFCFQQDPKTWKTTISPSKCSYNCNDGAHEKSDTLQHYCIPALNDLKRSCTAESAQHLLGASPYNGQEGIWKKQPNSGWAQLGQGGWKAELLSGQQMGIAHSG